MAGTKLNIACDLTLYGAPLFELERDIDLFVQTRYEPADRASPRWVECPYCAALPGNECLDNATGQTMPGWHTDRFKANRERLRTLPSWATEVRTPCCGSAIWLCWRTVSGELSWAGVPCFICERTYAFECHESDLIPNRQEIDRLHPDRVEMLCWATIDPQPWRIDDARGSPN